MGKRSKSGSKIKMDKSNDIEFFKNYLGFACQFEEHLYLWKQSMKEANRKAEELHEEKECAESAINEADSKIALMNDLVNKQLAPTQSSFAKFTKKQNNAKTVFTVGSIIFFIVGVFVSYCMLKESQDVVSASDIPIILFFAIPIALAFSIVTGFLPICLRKIKKYSQKAEETSDIADAATGKEKIEIIARQRDISRQIASECDISIQNLKTNQAEIFNGLQEATKTLNEIYGMNVLPAKYRNLVAVVTLYEYIDTGRCTTVKGHGGIFDTFENDLRAQLIIDNLNEINQKLSNIEQNQKYLIREMQMINSKLTDISYSLKSIERSSAETARNTAISAEANRQTAASLKWANWNMWARGYWS